MKILVKAVVQACLHCAFLHAALQLFAVQLTLLRRHGINYAELGKRNVQFEISQIHSTSVSEEVIVSVLTYNIFDDTLFSVASDRRRGVSQVSMPAIGEECLRGWWHRRFVDGVDTVTLMRDAQGWVDRLAIAAVAMLEVEPLALGNVLPPHELRWLLDLHARLQSYCR